MRKHRASTSLAWSDVDRLTQRQVEATLMAHEPFVDLMPWDPHHYRARRVTKPVNVVCRAGHPIVRVVIAADPMMGATRNGVWEMALATAGVGDEWIPVSERTVLETSPGWQDGLPRVWGCSADGCREDIPWGESFCPAHSDEPEPTAVQGVHDRRFTLRCPQDGCTFYAVRRHTTLLVEVAVALLCGKRTARLRD